MLVLTIQVVNHNLDFLLTDLITIIHIIPNKYIKLEQ